VVGTPDLRKGFDRLRPLLDLYTRQYGPCRCIIVGHCSEADREQYRLLPPFSAGLEISYRLNLTEEQLYEEYARAGALIHVARYESFGYPVLEAAALGTPVIATPTGIAPELLAGTLARFLVDGDNPAACARALATAWENRAQISRELRARHQASFTREHMVQAYLNIVKGWGRDG
jgi:glycosyltransferase involved in cell wall biosynthesis